ncbi:MAG: hypothetical protein CRN43_04835 [Candidatus Nephrothrix sp. EaCA]|nr:MAG: hypothetical protein CRN43_04835 [Candidatus Nephrothrix sp. EaCA]
MSNRHQIKHLLLLALVFLFAGGIICMNDILLPCLKELFKLSYTQATVIQQSFYAVYLFFPIPIAHYISQRGYKAALIAALLSCALGCGLFMPAYFFSSYILALLALFIVSFGVTIINVAANPLAGMLGGSKGSQLRINFVQVFCRIGFSATPILGSKLIYANDREVLFFLPYLCLGTGIVFVAIFIGFSSLPIFKPTLEAGLGSVFSIIRQSRKYPQLFWGIIAMFFYMGADPCIAGFFISCLQERGFSPERAVRFLTYFHLAAGVSGFLAIGLLKYFSAGILLAFFGLGIIILLLFCIFASSSWNPYLWVALGFFIAMMFPTIFGLGIENLGGFTERGSALLNMAIAGGAIFPPIQGMIADVANVRFSYIVPCFCFLFVAGYGFFCAFRKGNGLGLAKSVL